MELATVENSIMVSGFTVPETTALKSVCIMGKGGRGKDFEWGSTDEVWGVNNVAAHPEYEGKKFDRLFAFDILEQEYTDGMKRYAPITSWQDYADVKYPLDEIISEFKTEYFTNTISYMLAYAAYLKLPKVEIHGVDVTFGAPYAQENRGIEYWIGRAQERGVEVIVPETSHLLRTVSGAMYGRRDRCNMLLFLHERVNLINVLPRCGYYGDALKAQNAWWVLFPKSDEAQAHGVQVQRDPAGNMSFGFGQMHNSTGPMVEPTGKMIKDAQGNETPETKPKTGAEYAYDVHMPPETWEYLRDILRKLEAKGELPFGVISAYEKLILANPDGGN